MLREDIRRVAAADVGRVVIAQDVYGIAKRGRQITGRFRFVIHTCEFASRPSHRIDFCDRRGLLGGRVRGRLLENLFGFCFRVLRPSSGFARSRSSSGSQRRESFGGEDVYSAVVCQCVFEGVGGRFASVVDASAPGGVVL